MYKLHENILISFKPSFFIGGSSSNTWGGAMAAPMSDFSTTTKKNVERTKKQDNHNQAG